MKVCYTPGSDILPSNVLFKETNILQVGKFCEWCIMYTRLLVTQWLQHNGNFVKPEKWVSLRFSLLTLYQTSFFLPNFLISIKSCYLKDSINPVCLVMFNLNMSTWITLAVVANVTLTIPGVVGLRSDFSYKLKLGAHWQADEEQHRC